MNQRATINPSIHYDIHSDDVAHGNEIAQEVWLTTGEGVSLEGASIAFAEAFIGASFVARPEVLAAMLHGAANFFLSMAAPAPKTVYAEPSPSPATADAAFAIKS